MIYKYFPQNKDELTALVNNKRIKLSNIDISKVDDLSNLFKHSMRKDFSGIEDWNVSHVTDMTDMFCSAECENLPFWYDVEKWEEYETIASIKIEEQD